MLLAMLAIKDHNNTTAFPEGQHLSATTTGVQMGNFAEICSENLFFRAEGEHTSEMHITMPPATRRALRPMPLRMWPSTTRIDAMVPRTITTPTYRHTLNTAELFLWRMLHKAVAPCSVLTRLALVTCSVPVSMQSRYSPNSHKHLSGLRRSKLGLRL